MATLHEAFKEILLDTALAGTGDELDPSEALIYRPNGGDPRTIRGVVTRDTTEMGNARTPAITIRVANDATDGIDSDNLDLGADTIDVAERPGDTATTRTFGKLLTVNPAFLRLEIE